MTDTQPARTTRPDRQPPGLSVAIASTVGPAALVRDSEIGRGLALQALGSLVLAVALRPVSESTIASRKQHELEGSR